MQKKRIFAIFIALTSTPVAQLTNASESQFYIGAGGGTVTPALQNYGDATGQKIFAGYTLNEYVGLEAGYLSTDKSEYNGFLLNPAGFNFKFSGEYLSVVGSMPAGHDFSIFCKAGAWQWKRPTVYAGRSYVDNGPGAIGGVGLQYLFNGKIGIRTEFEYFDFFSSGEKDVTYISASLIGRF